MDDAEAIQRLRRGDIHGLEALVRRHQVAAIRAAYLVVRDRGLAQDLVQAGFLKAYDRAGGFDVGRSFGPWFVKLVLNDAIKAATRRARETHLADAVSVTRPSAEPGPEDALERAETADEIWAALGALTPIQRAAVVQRYYLGLTEAEIAAANGCPPPSRPDSTRRASACARSCGPRRTIWRPPMTLTRVGRDARVATRLTPAAESRGWRPSRV
jgi:RNA polymerase sigma-70 factor (ECF subfamily)